MAQATLETIIANPARKAGRRKVKNMAKRMTLKQKLHFGTARQRAAAKASMKSKRKRKNTARKRCNPSRRRPAVKRKRRNPGGELIAITLGNPARKKRRNNTVAKALKRKNTSHQRRSNPAGRPRTRSNPAMKHHRRRNPSQIGIVVKTGVAVIGGAVVTKLATQAVLGSSNTGILGYAGNAVATGLAAWATHAFTKDKAIAQGVVVGGAVQIILRVINDYTPYGSMLALSGLGDYQVANFPTPSWYPNGLRSASPANPWAIAAPVNVNSSGAGSSGTPNWM